MWRAAESWRVLPSGGIHLLDTDVLEHIRFRSDSKDIYAGLIGMAQAGIVKTVRQVFGELKKHPVPFGVLKAHEKDFVVGAGIQFCSEVRAKNELVKKHAGHLWAQTGGKNPDPADPWLIAVAAAHGYTLVTDENQLSPVKIPAACKVPAIGCDCISGPHFLIKVGLVKEIKPEHISPHAFFGITGGG